MPELFDHFEIDRVSRWPILSRLLGGSIVLHAIFLALVFYVPAVRDALNIASLLSGSDFVDKAYKKTNIEDRAQILNLPKFHYPEGYFYREYLPLPTDPNAPQIVAQATPTPVPPPVVNKGRRIKPPVSANVSPTPNTSPSPDPSKPAEETATTEQPQTPEEASAAFDKLSADKNIARPSEDEINKKPWKDWLKNANDLKIQGTLDLNKAVEVVISADFDENGQLVGNPRVETKSGDAVLIDLAKGMVSAIIDSNMLIFLKDPKTKRLEMRQLQITIKIDDQAVTAKVQSDSVSPERAKELSGDYDRALSLGRIIRQGKVEADLMKNTKVTSEGKQIIINFTMPRQEAKDLLKKQLEPST